MLGDSAGVIEGAGADGAAANKGRIFSTDQTGQPNPNLPSIRVYLGRVKSQLIRPLNPPQFATRAGSPQPESRAPVLATGTQAKPFAVQCFSAVHCPNHPPACHPSQHPTPTQASAPQGLIPSPSHLQHPP